MPSTANTGLFQMIHSKSTPSTAHSGACCPSDTEDLRNTMLFKMKKKYRNERRLCSKVERYLSIGVTVVRSDNAISTGSDCWNNRIPSTSPFSVQVEETGASGSESQEAYQAAAECRFLDGHGITRQCHSKGLYFSRKNFGEILISACEQVVKCR